MQPAMLTLSTDIDMRILQLHANRMLHFLKI